MDRKEVRDLYDASYAETYNQRFLLEGWARHFADFEEDVLRRLLRKKLFSRRNKRWLDVACGSGYFLNKFSGIERAGIDLSPAMLEVARRENPDALFFEERDFRDPVPEWNDAWDLVSCMWFSYSYVDTVVEVEQVIANLASWTSPDGACFVPVGDIEDIARGMKIPYLDPEINVFGGPLWITAFVWTWTDEQSGRTHKNLVSPHLDHMVAVFSRHFDEVEVVRYPPIERGVEFRRKAILARGKKR